MQTVKSDCWSGAPTPVDVVDASQSPECGGDLLEPDALDLVLEATGHQASTRLEPPSGAVPILQMDQDSLLHRSWRRLNLDRIKLRLVDYSSVGKASVHRSRRR